MRFWPKKRLANGRSSLFRSNIRAIIIAAGGLILIALAHRYHLGTPRPPLDTVEYHYARLLNLQRYQYIPENPNRKFPLANRLYWHVNGKPSISEQMQERQNHIDALVRLDYFQIKSLPFERTDKSKAATELQKKVGIEKIWDLSWVNGQDGVVWITARKEDMPAIAQALNTINSKTNR